ncbi:C2 and GRAM domain-containing protein At1g03370-like isoform X1 [Juglans microcarpa x Juglans regia]|uniref:C2 and GRAM domain-containing protein At1g03370-like isoform X1 n=1 Tax=Juglans microcarpa x Juglans regia TaxID=2249226 RepID=UPI001B7EE0EA|nr:C2 and GRAM domain-containing protein At1g03370-like isoform X1 [Juglans microcarpa x Juglans regia]
MNLSVRVIEARNLPAMDLNGFSDPYVWLQLGKQKVRTKVVKKSLNPQWGEEFGFQVDNLNEELLFSVLDEDKYTNDDFVGQLKMPVSRIFESEDKWLGPAWHSLQPKSERSKNKDCGEILLTIYFPQNNSSLDLNGSGVHGLLGRKHADETIESSSSGPLDSPSSLRVEEIASSMEDKSCMQNSIADRIAQIFNKHSDTAALASKPPETSGPEVYENKSEDKSSSDTFEELMRKMESRDHGNEIPKNLPGGVVLDQLYQIAPPDLNSLLFSPDSRFNKLLADLQGSTELQLGPWKFENVESLKRVVTYTKAATKVIKAVKATEEQMYLKADGKVFAVLASVSTPDIMYGRNFKAEVLYCITPGPELLSGEQSSHLIVSWRMNFLQGTMMKGIIENGARQGIKESFEQFASLLSESVNPVGSKALGSNKEQVLASLQVKSPSDWKLAVQHFANFTVVSSICMGLYVLVHIWLARPSAIQGLEFFWLDLPDSISEFIVCSVVVLQGERLLRMILRFMQARVKKGSNHGIKAQGDGWFLTVALVEGINIAAVDSSGSSDPYAVFTCKGKTRTSSIKFKKSDPQWNEIFEFDAMDELPSVLDVEVYNFDGSFDEIASLGHAEINFLKYNKSDLADLWIPLQGKLAQACRSKLHLRVFLDNSRGGNVVREYLSKMEKKVGKKMNVRSPQTNLAFQKLFGLPPEEFLINEFTCHLKRKMPLQGRLFLSARIIGFHTNLFGHKTKFFFLWEDIEDIQIVPPTLSSMGNPIIDMTLQPGRGMDAQHGAKTKEEGRLKFRFQSFVSFNIAHRTIMALWKARSLSPEQQVQIIEESKAKSIQTDESSSLSLDDVSKSVVYASALSVPVSFFMEVFSGGILDHRVMEKAGCLNYFCTPWELEKGDVYERHIHYKFDKNISCYRGEVTSTQQRSTLSDKNGWLVEEVMTLHGIPLGDNFNLHLRYQIEDLPPKTKCCMVRVFFGIAWLKSTKNQKRITKDILENMQDRLKTIFCVVEREFAAR